MLIHIVLATSLISMVSAESHEHQQMVNWNQRVLYGDTVNLTCADVGFSPHDHPDARYHWMLPSGNIIDQDTSFLSPRYTFVANGSTLLIDDIDKPDFGVYYCLVLKSWTPTVHVAVKLGVNVDGPYYGDLRAKYMAKLKTGALAGVAVLIFMSMLCYNYTQFEMRNDKPAPRQQASNTALSLSSLPRHFPGMSGATYLNTAFNGDHNDKLASPQMANDIDTKGTTHVDTATYDNTDVIGKKDAGAMKGKENLAYVENEPTTRF